MTIGITRKEQFPRWGMIYEGQSCEYRGVCPFTVVICGGPRSEMSPEGVHVSWVTLDGSCDSPPCVTPELAMLARIALADLGVEMVEPDPGKIVAVYE